MVGRRWTCYDRGRKQFVAVCGRVISFGNGAWKQRGHRDFCWSMLRAEAVVIESKDREANCK